MEQQPGTFLYPMLVATEFAFLYSQEDYFITVTVLEFQKEHIK